MSKFLQDVGNKFSNIVNPSSIDKFKSTIGKHQGIARTNRFALIMTPPEQSLLNLDIQSQVTNLLSGNSFAPSSLLNDPRDMSLLCETCSFPGRQITTIDYQTVRQPLKIPTGFFNEDITFTFLLTNDYYIKKMFDRWSELVLNTDLYKTGYLSDYARDVVIQQLNQANQVTYGIRLRQAFPISVNSIDMSNSDENTVVRLNVVFTYKDFVPENSIQSALGGIKTGIGGITRLI